MSDESNSTPTLPAAIFREEMETRRDDILEQTDCFEALPDGEERTDPLFREYASLVRELNRRHSEPR